MGDFRCVCTSMIYSLLFIYCVIVMFMFDVDVNVIKVIMIMMDDHRTVMTVE